MEIGQPDRIALSMAAAALGAGGAGDSQFNPETISLLVAAIHRLNRTEFIERGRELQLRRRGAGRTPLIDLVDLETGEVLDELAPDDVFHMASKLEA
jgi:hypothetical protein